MITETRDFFYPDFGLIDEYKSNKYKVGAFEIATKERLGSAWDNISDCVINYAGEDAKEDVELVERALKSYL
jgi:hypothetical protein